MSNENGLIKRDQYITRYEPQDFDGLARLSQAVVRSGLAPREVKSPEDAMVILMTGAELGLTAMQSLRSIHVVKGKPTMAADLMKALVLSSGECEKWEYEEKSKSSCKAIVQRKGSAPSVYEWTMEDARNSGLLSNPTWQKYPSQMLRHRVDSDAARGEFPHLILGIYTPDELADSDPPPVKARTNPTLTGEPGAPRQQPEPEVVDAEFEEAPAPAPKKAQPRKSMRADSKSKQFDQYDAIRRSEQADRDKQRADAARIAAGEFALEGESIEEKKAWATHNAAIHAMAAGLNQVWYRAFHKFMTDSFKVKNWKALSSKQLAMIRKRLDQQVDPVDWIKETCRGSVEAPAFKGASDGWRAVSELIHEVTKSNKQVFQGYAQAILQEFDAETYEGLGIDQLQTIWEELATLKALPPNGGDGGEISEREEYLMSVGVEAKDGGYTALDDGIPF